MSATHKIATPDMPDGEFFFSVMRDSDAGQMLHQLDDHCKALISSVLKFGGKGSVTLKLSVSKCGEERLSKEGKASDAEAKTEDEAMTEEGGEA